MIADFTWPVAQEGWLECDGSDVNITTYGALFAVMTIQMNGTRSSGNNVITSLTSTTNMRVGYYIYGTGIPEDTTITLINSATQITISTNASSTGTSNVIVSPWRLGAGTIRLPNISAAGRFRRSRSSSTAVGQLQSSSNLSHTHTASGITGTQSANHTHTYSGSTGTESANHSHALTSTIGYRLFATGSGGVPGAVPPGYGGADFQVSLGGTGTESQAHSHAYSGTSSLNSGNHTHAISMTTDSTGSTETRPETIVVMTCVKT